MRYIITFLLFALISFFSPSAYADVKVPPLYEEATVTNVTTDTTGIITKRTYELTLKSGKKVQAEIQILPKQNIIDYKKGDAVIVNLIKTESGDIATIVDYVRKKELLALLFLFIAIVIAIGRWHGVTSFLGMIASFAIIMWFIVPNIILGNNPVVISLLGGVFMIPITFYLAHGINKKTSIAVVGTLIALALTGGLAFLFVGLTKLTGFAAEEAVFIQTMTSGSVNIKNLLLAGIMIGAIGILDDITISQASIVDRLAHANPKYTARELFQNAMVVGRDHIASLVNTLVLVYTGASLPLFLLMYEARVPYSTAVNHEIIATEIVRTLVSSIGIIAAVPITTAIACMYLRKKA